jgi:predicted permease
VLDTLKTDVVARTGSHRRVFGRRVPGAQDLLVTTQVALSVILLVVAGLVLRTLATVNGRDPGFAYDRMVAAQISTSSTEVAATDRGRFLMELARDLQQEPWVDAVAGAGNALLSPHSMMNTRFPGQEEPVPLVTSRANPGFFRNLEIEVLEGRPFAVGDTAGAPDVAIVNATLAAQYFPGQSPLGQPMWWPSPDGTQRRFEIVGVTGDVMARNFLIDPEPMAFVAGPQHPYGTSNALMITPSIDPSASVPMLYRWLRDYESFLAIINVLPYAEVVSGFVYTQRMNAELFSLLAVFALILASVGIFGVMSLTVTQRTREVGIRMAIGARRWDVGGMMIRQAMVPVVLGVGAGLAASLALTRLVRSLLFGVEPTDPATLVGGTTVLVLAALAAAYLPSRRAASVDPVTALRTEA